MVSYSGKELINIFNKIYQLRLLRLFPRPRQLAC
jgi:hypothetical protein